MRNPRLRQAGEWLVLAATALCLIGHGVGATPPCLTSGSETKSYSATGTCGPAGVITVSSSGIQCSLSVTGDDVGLPTSGSANGKLDTGFSLSGSIDRDWDLHCYASDHASPDAGVSVPGTLVVTCDRRASSNNPGTYSTSVGWCQGELIPVTSTCNVKACPVPKCASGQHTAFTQPGCCAVCVDNAPTDVIPTPPPPVCHLETCPKTCPPGQELTTMLDAGVCCGDCRVVSQDCIDGRAQWKAELDAKLTAARACTTDGDCILTVIASRCGASCLEALSQTDITPISEWSYFRGNALCAGCFASPVLSECPNQIVGAICNKGQCIRQNVQPDLPRD